MLALSESPTNPVDVQEVWLGEIFWYFLKLGWLAFGGPVGQIGLMHLQVVERQKWIDEEEFLRALNFCHVLPGPEALQLAIYIGWKKGGHLAGALAGLLFLLPGFITLTALAWIYVEFGKRPEVLGVLWGFRPVGLALLLAALVRISRAALKGMLPVALAIAAFVAFYVVGVPFLLSRVGACWVQGPRRQPATAEDVDAPERAVARHLWTGGYRTMEQGMSRSRLISFVVVLASGSLPLSACKQNKKEVVVYTSVDQVFSEPIFKAFERESGIAVRAVFDTEETKSTGVLNRLVAEAQRPQADVFWANDPVRPFLLVKRGMAAPYLSPNATGIPAAFRAADGMWTDFAARARILLINKKRVSAGQIPRSIRDLANPRWKGQTAMANPLFGTTTMHVAALFTAWGEEKAQTFMDSLKANNIRIASSNGEVKRLVVGGEVAFGIADTDDGQEAVQEGAPVEVVYPDQDGMGTLVMPTAVVLINGAPHAEPGKRLIDYLLLPDVERRMAEAAAHMPVRAGVATPPSVKRVQDIRAMQVDYAAVGTEMERIQPWLRQWVGL